MSAICRATEARDCKNCQIVDNEIEMSSNLPFGITFMPISVGLRGKVKLEANGDWPTPRALQVQFRGISSPTHWRAPQLQALRAFSFMT